LISATYEEEEPATKRQKGAGYQTGGHYVGVDSGEATASQVNKYKHQHSKAQTENAKGAYVRKSGRHSKASSPSSLGSLCAATTASR
jgi:hypothetical protein